jgi:hypothetical protein
MKVVGINLSVIRSRLAGVVCVAITMPDRTELTGLSAPGES